MDPSTSKDMAIEQARSLTGLAQKVTVNRQDILNALSTIGSLLENIPNSDEKEATERILNAARNAHRRRRTDDLTSTINALIVDLQALKQSGGRRKTRRRKSKRSRSGTKSNRL